MALVEINGATKKYHRSTTALRDVTVSTSPGEFIYIVGPSSAGKPSSTKLLYREEKISAETLKVGEFNLTKLKKHDVPTLHRNIGVVFQDYKLLPKKAVLENVAYVIQVTGEKPREIRKRMPEVLDLVEPRRKMRLFPDQLSGDEQQRAAITRMIVNNPKVSIADEPTGNLDPEISWEIIQSLRRVNLQGTTTLTVTHNEQIIDNLRHHVIATEDSRIVRDEEEGGYGYDD